MFHALDAHLKVLQSLSAHLKLLLDAPEHLWRLLEKNQYLQAAWLFLLARVVHRAMVTEDPEEAEWRREGINVLVNMGIIQVNFPDVVTVTISSCTAAVGYCRTISSTNCPSSHPAFARNTHIFRGNNTAQTLYEITFINTLPASVFHYLDASPPRLSAPHRDTFNVALSTFTDLEYPTIP